MVATIYRNLQAISISAVSINNNVQANRPSFSQFCFHCLISFNNSGLIPGRWYRVLQKHQSTIPFSLSLSSDGDFKSNLIVVQYWASSIFRAMSSQSNQIFISTLVFSCQIIPLSSSTHLTMGLLELLGIRCLIIFPNLPYVHRTFQRFCGFSPILKL